MNHKDEDEAREPQAAVEQDETVVEHDDVAVADDASPETQEHGEAGDAVETQSADETAGDGEPESRAEDADAGGTEEAEAGVGDRDPVFERIVTADPAADADLRLGVLRAKVDAARSEHTAEVGTIEVAVVGAPGDELAARRERRRRPWLVAAAVAGVVAIGGAGYGAGTAGILAGGAGGGAETSDVTTLSEEDDSSGELSGAEPAIPLPGIGEGDGGGGDDAAASSEAARGGAGGSADMSYPTWFEGRAVFRASGLSTERGTAEAYALDAREVATRESARRLAEALGVKGDPRWNYGAWMVGSEDGKSPTVWLSADGSAYFSYNDPRVDPWRCEVLSEETAEGEGDGGGVDSMPESCQTPSATTLSGDEARKALRDVMTRIGLDVDAYEIEVQPTHSDEPMRWATAYQVVDGKRTGVQFSASVADKGVAWVDGALAQPVSIGDYPVISPTEAVDRLGDPRFSGSSWPIAYAEEQSPIEEQVDPAPDKPTAPPAPPEPGSAISWPVSEVVITEARLALSQHHQRDGTVMILPTYELSDAKGNAWSVIAVAEEKMDFSVPER
jgi:hypothetical protein